MIRNISDQVVFNALKFIKHGLLKVNNYDGNIYYFGEKNKKFHVSPFIEMNCRYFFKVLNPEEKLSVVINQSDEEGKLLYASQDGFKKELSSKNLIFSYISHPLMTFKIIGAIHLEALKIWLKGVKFVKKKVKIKNNITFET